MSGYNIMYEGIPANRAHGPIGSAQTFDVGDPLKWSSNTLVVASTSPLVNTECVGFALEPAEGIRAGSRAADSGTAALAAGMNGPASRTYVPIAAPGLRLHTANVWADGAVGTFVAPVAADLGAAYEMTVSSGTWGVEKGAMSGAELGAVIQSIWNSDGLPITYFGGTGASIVFTLGQTQSETA
jgi:hypothetical protein